MDDRPYGERERMLKVYEKNGKTIILDTDSGNWVRMNEKFYDEQKYNTNFQELLKEKYFNNSKVREEKVDTIYFAITRKCNLNCKFCSVSSNNSVDTTTELSVEEIKEKLYALLDQQIRKIVITGGEPLTKQGLIDVFAFIKNIVPDSEIILQTNGVLLNEQFITSLQKYVNVIEISVENIVQNKELQDKMEKIFQMIMGKNILLSLSYVVTQDNIKYLQKCLMLVKKYNAFFSYRIVEPLGKGKDILEQFDDRKAYRTALEVEKEILSFIIENMLWNYNLVDGVKGGLLPKGICGAYADILAIQPNGKIYPCINITEDSYELGDLKRDSVEELKHLLNKNEKRNRLKNRFDIEYKNRCESCFYKYFCNGICTAHTIGHSKDIINYCNYVCKLRQTYLDFEMFYTDKRLNIKDYIRTKHNYYVDTLSKIKDSE